MNNRVPTGKDILALLIKLKAKQEKIRIRYEIEKEVNHK